MKPTLVIMAAGMGSRYGGLKQIEPVGPNGEIMMEYSIYDAMKAGFNRVVFVINKEMEHEFREKIGYKIEKIVDTTYVFQDINLLPLGFTKPEERVKPWGTGHAVLSCKKVVKSPFAVINADDFYGLTSFQMLSNYLWLETSEAGFYQYCMVGFELDKTLTENGYVARGVCNVDSSSYLIDIVERTHIEKFGGEVKYTEDNETFHPIDKNSIVSLNTWGFTTSIFSELEKRFSGFLQDNSSNLLKAEYFLPSVVDMLIKEKQTKVKVLPCKERWYGVTYKEDKPIVVEAIKQFIAESKYPYSLWSELEAD